MTNSGYSSGSLGTVSAVFFTKKDADSAYDALIKQGHTPDDISILMSDETLSSHENLVVDSESTDQIDEKTESQPETTSDIIANAIISITSMISLPGLGIAISKTLFRKIAVRKAGGTKEEIDDEMAAKLVEQHNDSYGDSMKEGGIIVSADPRSFDEKKAIIRNFRENNGHDILGDDGYTELD